MAAAVPASTPSPSPIPVVDFAPFLTPGADADARKKTADAVVAAFRDIGFVFLANHGVPDAALAKVYAHAKTFFALPYSTKMTMEWESAESNRGYSEPGREKVTQVSDAAGVQALREAVPDLKESFEIGREEDETYRNRWPDGIDGFRETMLEFFESGQNLHVQIMRAVAVGLGLDEFYFDKFIDEKDNTLRLLHYPAVEKTILQKEEQMRAGAHTDYGTITLLFQDSAGGLQVQRTRQEWVDATPIPGTVVVNAGDLLMRWSNDVIKSTMHRVVAPPPTTTATEEEGAQTASYPARYSIPYFCNANPNAVIESLPGIGGDAAKYPPIRAFDHLVERLRVTY
ncbi:thymine dioxygenase [Zopfochytrium polystomum]|nr:thymine dioxygenase [Zopfochytrium polystomum]